MSLLKEEIHIIKKRKARSRLKKIINQAKIIP
jgi:hypothetical protein